MNRSDFNRGAVDPMTSCECLNSHAGFSAEDQGAVMQGPSQSDVWILKCKHCSSNWVRVLYEAEQYSGGGHWYDALLPSDCDATSIDPMEIDEIFQASTKCFTGGSYHQGKVFTFQGVPKRLV